MKMVVVPHRTSTVYPKYDNTDEGDDTLTWVTKYCPGLTQLDGGDPGSSPVYTAVTPDEVKEQLPL